MRWEQLNAQEDGAHPTTADCYTDFYQYWGFAPNTESQTDGKVWFVSDLKTPAHSSPPPWAETLPARPGAQSPVQTDLEHIGFKLINLFFPVGLLCLTNITLSIPTM